MKSLIVNVTIRKYKKKNGYKTWVYLQIDTSLF